MASATSNSSANVVSRRSGVGQFGAGEEKSLRNHGEDELTLPRRLGGDEILKSQLADHRQDGLNMAMRERASVVRKVSAAGTKVSPLRERLMMSMR